jgi:urea transport system permease protein
MVNAGKSYFTGALPDLWLFALGALFVLTALFLPRGVVGLLGQWRAMTARRETIQPPPVAPTTLTSDIAPSPRPAE